MVLNKVWSKTKIVDFEHFFQLQLTNHMNSMMNDNMFPIKKCVWVMLANLDQGENR